MRTWIPSILLATCLLGSACSSGPKYKIDDLLLADVAVSEKQGMLAAQSEINQAKEELNKAQSDLAIAERDVSVADSELGQAKLEVSKAKADVEFANGTKDLNRINQAKGKLTEVELARDVADAKYDWQKQRRRHAKALIEAAEEHINASLSRYEQEKARLAAAKGKQPDPKFNVGEFDQQANDARGKWDSARAYADKQNTEAMQLEQQYNQLNQKLAMQRGMNNAQSNPPSGQPSYPQQGSQPAYPPPSGQPAYPPSGGQPAYPPPGGQTGYPQPSQPMYQPPPT